MRPIGVPAFVKQLRYAPATNDARIAEIRKQYGLFNKDNPEVSIIIPAYNEENDILPTLQSLVATTPKLRVEIIVVNNNSTDTTEKLVAATGIKCITEMKAGVTAARNAGLAVAKGKYIMNADADTTYPPGLVDAMVGPLITDEKICLTYGRYAFIPTGATSRFTYFIYEHIVGALRWFKKTFKEEAVNVGGFNSCFRREQGLAVDGYDHPPGANEDGFLALKLRNNGFGKLLEISSNKTLSWTTDRRIQIDGGLIKGIIKRILKVFFNTGEKHPSL